MPLCHVRLLSEVYAQIINDLENARNLLSDKYVDSKLFPYAGIPERVRPTKWAASAMLARVFLYTGHFAEAAENASSIIEHNGQYALSTLSDLFLAE